MHFEGTPEVPRDDRPASGDDSRIQSGMCSDPTPSNTAEVIPIRASISNTSDVDDNAPPPVWMQRANIVMKFLICVWLGMVVSVLPWTPAWSDNSLILS